MLSGRKEFLSSCIYKIMISAHMLPHKQTSQGMGLANYRNQSEKSIHSLPKGHALHLTSTESRKSCNLSFLTVFGTGKIPRVESI